MGQQATSIGLASLVCLGCSDIDLSPQLTSGSEPTGSTSGASSDAETTASDDPSVADLYAQARCAAIEACGCDLEPFEGTAACLDSMRARFSAVLDQLDTGTVDLACLTAVLQAYESSSCETHLEIGTQGLAPDCLLVYGDDEEGENCQRSGGTFARGDTCAQGLRCAPTMDGRRCVPVGSTDHVAAPGQPCALEHDALALCEAGTYCDVAVTDTCVPRLSTGTVCPIAAACEPLAWCDAITDPDVPVCAPRLSLGSTCTTTAACESAPCIDGACARVVCHASTCTDAVAQVCFVSDL